MCASPTPTWPAFKCVAVGGHSDFTHSDLTCLFSDTLCLCCVCEASLIRRYCRSASEPPRGGPRISSATCISMTSLPALRTQELGERERAGGLRVPRRPWTWTGSVLSSSRRPAALQTVMCPYEGERRTQGVQWVKSGDTHVCSRCWRACRRGAAASRTTRCACVSGSSCANHALTVSKALFGSNATRTFSSNSLPTLHVWPASGLIQPAQRTENHF